MTSATIAAIAIAAPLVVALICFFTWQRLDGGRHLLFWSIGHLGLAAALGILGFSNWTSLPWPLAAIAVAGNQLWTVMLAAGIRVLIGRGDSLRGTLLLVGAVTAAVLLLQPISEAFYYLAPTVTGCLFLTYAGVTLLRHRRSILYTLTGLLLLVRAMLTLSLGLQLLQVAELNGALTSSIFVNLLTGLGLILMEFDNARQREAQARGGERETRVFFETVLDVMPATMTYKDTSLRYRIINRRMHELMSMYGSGFIGRTWADIVGETAAMVVEEADRRILATGEPEHMEQVWTGPDGRRLVLMALKVPLRDMAGQVIGIITCGVDITRLKETEAQLIEQREAAETASRVKTSFLANMSHELRTPLNAIIGFADMMAAGYAGPLTPRQQDYTINVRDSGEHLLRLVNDILDLSRLESGRLEISIEDCSFDRIAQSALAMVEPQARQAEVTLDFEPPGLTLRADERALTQILINLLGNAVKFNRPGGTVTLRATEVNGVVGIRVSDTGIGMSEAESRAVVQPLYRSDVYRSRANSGAGLGLSICRSLVELHGGRMELRSEPGIGTTVEIALPA